MHSAAVAGRDRHALGQGDIIGVQIGISVGEGLEAAVGQRQRDHGGGGGGAGGDEREPIASGAQVGLDRREWQRQRLEVTAGWAEDAEMVDAVLTIAAGDAAVGQEGVGGVVQFPGGVSELGFHGQQQLRAAVPLPVQIPPAGAVGDEVQRAVGRPLRLGDRLVAAACDALRRSEVDIRTGAEHIGDPQVTAVPG
ncbi:MAG: hypothetical protein M3308_00930 [Actinomycetota bacterium]|nr:hypothetical protein [Actinomycetota bacterium]